MSGLSRRRLLQGAACTVAAAAGDALLPRLAFAAAASTSTSADVLVVVSLRGGLDGLGAVVPAGDARYHDARRGLAVADRTAIPLDGRFGLHPAMAPLRDLWDDRRLGIVHAVGQPAAPRSHFEATTQLELAGGRDGWIARHLAATGTSGPLSALAMPTVPQAMRGDIDAVGAASLADLRIGGGPAAAATLGALYQGSALAAPAAEALRAVELVARSGVAATRTGSYPAGPLGAQLQQVAQLVKADVGLSVAAVSASGWDLHDGMGDTTGGPMRNGLGALASGVAAFFADLGARGDRVCLVTLTEFGRQVATNGSGGTDHGRGTCLFAAGAGIAGGRVLGSWPGLGADRLDGGGLAVTTDVRDVLWEIVRDRLGGRDVRTVFPGLRPEPVGLTVPGQASSSSR